jgi:hypothetical protein
MRQAFGTLDKPGLVPLGTHVVVYREADVSTKKGMRMSDFRVMTLPPGNSASKR